MDLNINRCSEPSSLKITDIRVTNINGAPKHCPLIKIYTNQGIVGCGEVRDASSATYALMLKSRLVGENPCNVDKLFRRIKQFGGHSRQGGALEMKKLGDMCEKYGVAMAIHMAESPIACMAAIHAAAAVQNVLAVEFHSVDIPWWNDLAIGIDNPIFKDGFVNVPNKPGLGIDTLNEELIAEHIHEKYPGQWEPTTQWHRRMGKR